MSALVFAIVVAFGGYWEGLLIADHSATESPSNEDRTETRSASRPAESAPSLEESIRALSARLTANPEDLEGWVLLGRSYLVMGRHQEAVQSFSRAKRLDPRNPDILVSLGEALVLAAGDRVTPDAAAAFESALDIEPAHPVARYFKALSLYQKGEREKAIELWRALLEEAPREAPWRAATLQRLADAGEPIGANVSRMTTEGPATSGPSARLLEGAPAIANAPPEERAAMIQSMVEGLSARLEEDPGDLDGWRMLIRSYGVLGRHREARDRLLAAIENEPPGTALRGDLERLAVELYGKSILD